MKAFVAGLGAGTYAVFLEAPGADQPGLEKASIELAAGEQRLEVVRSAPTGTVRYRLRFRDGGAPHAPVVWLERRGSTRRCRGAASNGCSRNTPGVSHRRT